MAVFTKYYCFARDVHDGVHDVEGTTHTFKIALSNTSPNVSTHELLADVSELATANGYTAGGIDTGNNGVEAAGVLTVTASGPITWTASGAGITARYFILYNFTVAGGPLMGFWDRGTSTTVPAGQTITLGDGSWSMFSIS